MGQSERSLTALGRRVATLQEQSPEAQLDRERGRARFLARNGDEEIAPGEIVTLGHVEPLSLTRVESILEASS